MMKSSVNLISLKSAADCPPCLEKRNIIKHAVEAYWRNDLLTSYACACNHLLKKPGDGLAEAITYSITQSKHASIRVEGKVSAPSNDAPPLKKWEILGPINVGKLEIDADPTFLPHSGSPTFDSLDVSVHVLSMRSNESVFSELAVGGRVGWAARSATENGEVGVQFPLNWNELAQGLSAVSVYEFQAWARIVSYAKVQGSYLVSCSGAHTVYLRNDNITHTLVGDVYRSGQVMASVQLRVGLVGIVVPLRGMAQSQFRCSVQPVSTADSIAVYAARHIPDLLETASCPPGKGYMLTSVFALPVQNLQSSTVVLEFGVEKPLGQEGEFFVREARPLGPLKGHQNHEGEVSVAPGQTMLLSLELLPLDAKPVFISCRKNRPFTVTINPSRGAQHKVLLDFGCRTPEQSFSISYVDHDHSVTQAAVVFPLKPAVDWEFDESSAGADEAGTCASEGGPACAGDASYPVLLSMHGSGITASSHADAHKQMRSGETEYVFGVEDFILLAPSRFGAHNWEGVGELSAKHALLALQRVLQRSALPLPQVRLGGGLSSGHSMGAHGAWLAALNSPDLFSCLAPVSGWINKEEYGDANAFFRLDIGSSFTDPRLKLLLEQSMSDTHTDKLLANAQGMDVHVRVGSADATVSPWYSRRAHRLLAQHGVNSTLEELPGKQHWWWDTASANDGGVVNDPRMRAFYASCAARAGRQLRARRRYVQLLNESTAAPLSDSAILSLSNATHQLVSDRPCARNVTLVLVNPGTHSGLCGLQVQQQMRAMGRTTVRLSSHSGEGSLRSSNVRRLRLQFGYDSALFGVRWLHIDGVAFDLTRLRQGGGDLLNANSSTGETGEKGETLNSVDSIMGGDFQPSLSLDICWDDSTDETIPSVCQDSQSPIAEKSLDNGGPVRALYRKPFCIVYGTPSLQVLRLAIRELAVYIGNAHFAAHGTRVRVLSDLEYRAGSHAKRAQLENIMFVGGPAVNKAMNTFCRRRGAAWDNSTFSSIPLYCDIPEAVGFGKAKGGDSQFSFDGTPYTGEDEALIFTLPFHRPDMRGPALAAVSASVSDAGKRPAVGMAVCVHANSALGYQHLSRLAWPVAPPMVRAPFALYLPDFFVVSSRLWSHGFGGVLAAGYWNNQWELDPEQAYVNSAPYA
ncbi:hypothetical protein B484DRAFT_399786 [Ochromonadaceae sp. CCMP2298]|nr:hypothetical protein B484DRAFT_399786 [Ochromonadaceae sp. CCMP2298]